MHSLNPLSSFTGGEWSPQMDSRVDLPGYRKAARLMRNMFPLKTGGATRRPGTQFIANGKQGGIPLDPVSGLSRMQKFQYAPGTSFMLEFCNYGIRFYSNGLQVQATGVGAWASGTNYPAGSFVTSAGITYYLWSGSTGRNTTLINSTTAPAGDTAHWVAQTIYEVPAPYSAQYTVPDYYAADVFVLQCKQINDVVYIVHPNFPVWKLTRITDTNWQTVQVPFLTPALLDQNATDTTLTAGAVTGTGVSLTAAAPAWASANYYIPGNSVEFTQSGGAFGLGVTYVITSVGTTDFTLIGASSNTVGVQFTATGAGSGSGTASGIYNCLAPHTSGTFRTDYANGLWQFQTTFQPGHVGSFWQLAYNRPQSYIQGNVGTSNFTSATMFLIGTWEFATYGIWDGSYVVQASYDNGVTWQVVASGLVSQSSANFDISGVEILGGLYRFVFTYTAGTVTVPPAYALLTADNQFVYGLVEITGVTDAYDAICTVVTTLYSTNPTEYWSEGAWSNVRGYPQAVTIFQERAWYAGTSYQPQRLWGSQTDDLENFATVDSSQATYGLAFDLKAPERGPVQWLNAQTDLFCGLAGAEWIVSSGSPTAAITPTAVIALEHSANGSAAGVPGSVVGNAVFYVQRRGINFQQMLFSVFTNKYMSQDLQVTSQHITAAGIKQFDYQQNIQGQSILWAVCADGTLASMNYAMDQEVFGWSRHTTGGLVNPFGFNSGGDIFISCQVIYGGQDEDDELWLSVIRVGPIYAGASYCTIERMNPIDWQTANGGQPQLNEAIYADCSVTVTNPVSNVIGGIPFALGETNVPLVASLNGNVVFQNLEVTEQNVTLPNYVPAAGDVVVVGLPIPWFLKPMRFDLDPRAGEIPGIKKAIFKVYVKLLNSIGGNWTSRAGPVVALPTYPITQNSGNPPPFLPNQPVELDLDVGGFNEYGSDPQFILQGTDPLPFTCLSMAIAYDITEKS